MNQKLNSVWKRLVGIFLEVLKKNHDYIKLELVMFQGVGRTSHLQNGSVDVCLFVNPPRRIRSHPVAPTRHSNGAVSLCFNDDSFSPDVLLFCAV
jgi:hypothetical protein